MEQEHGHKMCDWCGNEYGRKYKWWRLILAILIGLFIFLAGIEIGQMRMGMYDNYGYGGHYVMHRGYDDGYMMNSEYGPQGGTTTIVVPASQTQNANGPMVPAGTTTTTTTAAPAGAVTH